MINLVQTTQASLLHVLSFEGRFYLFSGINMLIARIPESFARAIQAAVAAEEALPSRAIRTCDAQWKMFEALGDAGFFTPGISDEDKKLAADVRSCRSESLLVSLQIALTASCTLSCRYCYANGGAFTQKSPTQRIMALETLQRSLRTLLPRMAPRCEISLLGGEPLLHPSFPAVIDMIKSECNSESRCVALSVSTNGTVYSPALAKCLVINRVKTSVSIDGPASIQDAQRPTVLGEGSFSTVYANLRRFWDELGSDLLAVRITCTPESVLVIPEFLAELRETFPGIRTELAPVIVNTSNPLSLFQGKAGAFVALQRRLFGEEFHRKRNAHSLTRDMVRQKIEADRVFLRQPLIAKCEVGVNSASIATNGNLYPCIGLMDKEEYRLLYDSDGAFAIPPQLRELYIQNTVLTRSECANCWARYLCAGGCVAVNEVVTGSELTVCPDLCEIYRGAAEIALLGCIVSADKGLLGGGKVDWC